jgi:hypothetical protein
MEVSDMLDVVHYLFEEDTRFTSGDEARAQEKLRKELYRLYNKEYKYGAGSSATTYGGRAYIPSDGVDDFDDFDVAPVNVKKPYVPPTKFNPESASPFGSVLDAPLG